MVVIESPKEVDLAAEGAEGVEIVRGVAEPSAAPALSAPAPAPAPSDEAERERKERKKKEKKEKGEKGEGKDKDKDRKEKRRKERKESKAAEAGEAAAAAAGGASTSRAGEAGSAAAVAAEGTASASGSAQPPGADAATGAAAGAPAGGKPAGKVKAPPPRNGVPKPGPKITVDSGITMDMMRVALAAWDGKDQGPKEEGAEGDSPRGKRGVGGADGGETDLEAGEGGQSPSAASASSAAVLDPQATRPILSARFNQVVVLLNVGLGLVYLCWRVFRSMNPKQDWRVWAPVGAFFVDPDDPEKAWSVLEELRWNWFKWVLFLAEVFLMLNIWLGHGSRCFPVKRTKCTMDDLVDVDFDLSKRTQVCIVLPTRGEPLNVLREGLLHCMSLNLWPGKLDVRRNARLVVVDDRRRAEVLLLLALCYRFAALFCNNRKVSTSTSTSTRRGQETGLDWTTGLINRHTRLTD